MPDGARLSVSRGQLGPLCDGCGTALLFAECLTIDQEYLCPDCYASKSGVESATEPRSVGGLPMD